MFTSKKNEGPFTFGEAIVYTAYFWSAFWEGAGKKNLPPAKHFENEKALTAEKPLHTGTSRSRPARHGLILGWPWKACFPTFVLRKGRGR